MDFLMRWMEETASTLVDLSPWLALGLLLAGVLHVVFPARLIRLLLGRRGFRSVFWAAMIGVPMPLCSCGVLPAALGMKKDGASDGAAVSFLISTPQTGVDSILVSARFLGWPFALFKVFSALVTGVVGGVLADLFGGSSVKVETAPACEAPPRGLFARVVEVFRFGFGSILGGIYAWIAFGVVAAGLISAVTGSARVFENAAWMQGIGGMLLMLVIALPMYVCAVASVPIAASLVTGAGLPAGAALVFLMAGPAVSAASLGAVYRAFGRRVTAIYVGTIAVSSVLLGLTFDWVVAPAARAAEGHCMTHTLPRWLELSATGLIVAMIAGHALAALRRRLALRAEESRAMASPAVRLSVQGMTCHNCVRHVEDALKAVAGVTGAQVDLGKKLAVVTGERLDPAKLAGAVTAAGYPAAPA